MEITFEIPAEMKPAEVAKTFAAYLLGSQAFRNADLAHGPFRQHEGSDESWQLDGTNDYFLHIDGNKGMLRDRYTREDRTIHAMVMLFKAQNGIG
jgi:hypothetical protein